MCRCLLEGLHRHERAGQNDAGTALSKGAVKYIIKSEYEPKQVADMVKEILAGYTRNAVPEVSAPNKQG